MLEDPSLQLSREVGLIDGCQSFPSSLLNLGTTMTISKRNALPTAKTLYRLLLCGGNLVTTNGEADFLDLTMDDGETATFLGLRFHPAPSEELVHTLEEALSKNASIGGSTVRPSNTSPCDASLAPQSSISIHMLKRSGEMTQPIMMPTSSACQLVV